MSEAKVHLVDGVDKPCGGEERRQTDTAAPSVGASSTLDQAGDAASILPPEELVEGMILEIGELYRDSLDGTWDESIPEDVPQKDVTNEKIRRKAFVVRRQRIAPSPVLKLHSVVVHSPFLRAVLDRTFAGYTGINTKLKNLEFKAPLRPFYYRWHRFLQEGQSEQNPESRQHFSLFRDFIGKIIVPHIEKMADLVSNGVVTYDYLWAIFPPGIDVYTHEDGQDRMYRCVQGYEIVPNNQERIYRQSNGEGKPRFMLNCISIDTDGDKLQFSSAALTLDKFEGLVEISSLRAYPAHLHPHASAILADLQARGEAFEKLKGLHHVNYSGFFVTGRGKKRFVDQGRIIVDAREFDRRHGCDGFDQRQRSLDDKPPGLSQEDMKWYTAPLDVFCDATQQTYRRYVGEMSRHQLNIRGSGENLTARERVLCVPTVRGFCLRTKTWGSFYVDKISEIGWNTNAFEQLVLPLETKEIISVFVQEQLSPGSTPDDIVQGKGLGFIMLLAGDPGVGKTLTAESVAEKMEKPIYSVSAGELGEAAEEVEGSLGSILELTAQWDAVLLLDECDIFLETRSTSEIARNRLVAIFLRQLEYFKGVMFLTTNRASTLDAAFESRIHLTIDYQALSENSRLSIWDTFVIKAGNTNVVEEQLTLLARTQMNGRQIKNVVKTARLLAKHEKQPLSMGHLDRVLQVRRNV